jgi:hypothetical protein
MPRLLNLNKFFPHPEEISTVIRSNKPLKPFYSPKGDDETLVFESRFESGNLETVYKVSESEYHLVLQNDINTRGNTQWFLFNVKNSRKGLNVKFNIVNLGKSDSLYNQGMQVLVYSEQGQTDKPGWHRCNCRVKYLKNNLLRPSGKPYYSVSFSYTFSYSKDSLYFAYSHPYTYSHLMKYLLSLENDHQRQHLISRRSLCKSIGGNRCEFLTITDTDEPDKIKQRKNVFISARVHPGETVSSWMMQGIIDFLTCSSPEAETLRNRFVFRLLPMLNPDGVINGNYRTNLAGYDLNRKWKTPNKWIHPTIFYYKRLLKATQNEQEISFVCDLHGHSRSMGVFMYGCHNFSIPEQTRVFPLLLSRLSEPFEFPLCSFKMQKTKESTLRITMFKELSIPNVFTLESSFAGHNDHHFSAIDLMDLGRDLCLALLKYSEDSGVHRSLLSQELITKPELMQENENFSDSDSEPSEDELDPQVLQDLLPKTRVKRSKLLKNDKKKKSSKLQSFSAPRQRISPKKEVKLEPIKPREIKKCEICGGGMMPGHNCLSKTVKNLSPTPGVQQRRVVSSLSALGTIITYVNAKGKTVRDQASQTTYIRKVLNSDTLNLLNETTPEPRPLRSEFPLSVSVVNHKKLTSISSVLDVSGKKYRFHVS